MSITVIGTTNLGVQFHPTGMGISVSFHINIIFPTLHIVCSAHMYRNVVNKIKALVNIEIKADV